MPNYPDSYRSDWIERIRRDREREREESRGDNHRLVINELNENVALLRSKIVQMDSRITDLFVRIELLTEQLKISELALHIQAGGDETAKAEAKQAANLSILALKKLEK